MNLFILLLMGLCYQSSDSGHIQAGIHKKARPISKRSTRLWRRQDDFGYLEQCSILQFWDKQIGRVNVLAFFDSSWQFSHRQASMLRVLRERFERTGFDNIQFFAVSAPPGAGQFIDQSEIAAEEEAWSQISPSEAEDVPQLQLTPETLAEALGPHVYFIQDDERLQIWAKLRALRDQILVIDRCGRLTYQIIVPWSILHFPYVKAAILSTYKDEPCGYCHETGPDTLTTESTKHASDLEQHSSESSIPQTILQDTTTSIYLTENIKIISETSKEATTLTYQNGNTQTVSGPSEGETSTYLPENTKIVFATHKEATTSINQEENAKIMSETSEEATTSSYPTENTKTVLATSKEATTPTNRDQTPKIMSETAREATTYNYPTESTEIVVETSKEAKTSYHQNESIKMMSETSDETTTTDQNENTVITFGTDSALVITDLTENDNASSAVAEEFSSTTNDRFDDEVVSSTFEPSFENRTKDDEDSSINYDRSVKSTLQPDAAGSSSEEPPITDRIEESTAFIASWQSNEQSTFASQNEYTDALVSNDYLPMQTDMDESNDTTWVSEDQSMPVYRSNDKGTTIPDEFAFPTNLMNSTESLDGSSSREDTTLSTENYTSLEEDTFNQTDAEPIFRTDSDEFDPLALNNAFEDDFVNSTSTDYPDDYSNSTSTANDGESTTDDFRTPSDDIDQPITDVTTARFSPETETAPSEASNTTEREELRLTDANEREDWDDRDIKSRSTNARSVSTENSSRSGLEAIEVDSESSEEQPSSPGPDYVLPIRIIMRAPHVDEYSDRSMKAHEYLVLKTGQSEYHDHLDEVSQDGLGYVDEQQQQQQVPRPETVGAASVVRRTFGKDESPGLYGEVADYWRKIGNELDRTSTQLSAEDDYDEVLEHETNFTVVETALRPSPSSSSNGANAGKAADASETPHTLQEDNQTGSDKNENQETDSLEDDYDTDEEAKSQLIAHYSKLLPWLYYVLDK